MDNEDNGRIKQKTAHVCMLCGKQYKYSSGLSKHKKKCSSPLYVDKEEIINKDNVSTNVSNENESLKKEVCELRLMMKDMIKAQKKTTDNFTNTLDQMISKVGNTFNNKMSINVYLNEHCKDAMNLTDFIGNLKVSLEDLKYTKDHGYVKGISNIFVKQLQDMKPTERPIHCSDKKRLQFYVKDENQWKKDKVHSKIDKSIDDVTIKQIKQIKLWEKENPNYLNNERLLMQWHTMIHNAMGGSNDDGRVKNKDSIKKELGITLEVKKELVDK